MFLSFTVSKQDSMALLVRLGSAGKAGMYLGGGGGGRGAPLTPLPSFASHAYFFLEGEGQKYVW